MTHINNHQSLLRYKGVKNSFTRLQVVRGSQLTQRPSLVHGREGEDDHAEHEVGPRERHDEEVGGAAQLLGDPDSRDHHHVAEDHCRQVIVVVYLVSKRIIIYEV